jgi:very-short-patch-repair endonuclease
MGYQTDQRSPGEAIKHRVGTGRLHAVMRGVYAVGRPALTQRGRWMAAVLSCGPGTALSHRSAAALWGILPVGQRLDVTIPSRSPRRRPGITAHRRCSFSAGEVTTYHAIPTTTPICTLIDIATGLQPGRLEAAINEADRLDLVDPETLRSGLEGIVRRPGVRALREILDRRTFTLTDSELERRFLPLVRQAGLLAPLTGCHLNGFKVDFYWPDLGLVVETDGLRYHRTPAQQARDRLRDQVHAAAGIAPLRFTRAQVAFEPGHVQATLSAVARRLR